MTGLSPAHAAARIGRITGSTAAACLGRSKWRTPLEAWQAIRGDDEDEDNPLKERGRWLEPTILHWGGDKIGVKKIERPGFVIHPEHDWLGASADALYHAANGSLYVGEAKSMGLGTADDWGEPGTDQVPDDVFFQAHAELACHPDASRCAVPVLLGGWKFQFDLYWVDRDPAGEQRLIEQLGAWHHKHIVGGVRPEASAGDEALLKKLFPEARRGAIENGDVLVDVAKWAREYNDAHEQLKGMEAPKKLAGVKLRELLEDHDSARCPDGESVTYRNVKDKTHTDYKAIAESLGASESLIQQHTRVVLGHRTLRVTIPKPRGAKRR